MDSKNPGYTEDRRWLVQSQDVVLNGSGVVIVADSAEKAAKLYAEKRIKFVTETRRKKLLVSGMALRVSYIAQHFDNFTLVPPSDEWTIVE